MVFRQDIIGQSLERLHHLQNLYCEGLFEWGSPEHNEILLLEEFELFQMSRQKGLVNRSFATSRRPDDPAVLLRALRIARIAMAEVESQLGYNSPGWEASRKITVAIDGLAELLTGRRKYFCITAPAPRPAD